MTISPFTQFLFIRRKINVQSVCLASSPFRRWQNAGCGMVALSSANFLIARSYTAFPPNNHVPVSVIANEYP
jgi:hypothetical protein